MLCAEFSNAEDTRISKTLRRMVREEDPDAFSSLCIQLQVVLQFLINLIAYLLMMMSCRSLLTLRFVFQESIIVAENERYIRKAMEFICESILDMLHSGPCYETKFMAAKCLSHLAIALECDAKR